jgi:hypothetical protein
VLFEFIFGLRPEFTHNRLCWHIRGVEGFSVDRYPFGREGLLHLKLEPRGSVLDRPTIEITSTVDVTIELSWAAGSETIEVRATGK